VSRRFESAAHASRRRRTTGRLRRSRPKRYRLTNRRQRRLTPTLRSPRTLDARAIRHTVAFALRHRAGSDAERSFLAAAERLADIPGVEQFELLREVSPKNDFRFGISMELADDAAYAAYNAHPDHVRFVEERWIPEIADFLEIDYQARP
jgi:heme-degrading monooxygenase HmoA